MKTKNYKKAQTALKRKWYTMNEIRAMSEDELCDLVKSFGYSEQKLAKKSRADILAICMREQIRLKQDGYQFDGGTRP